MTTVPLTQARAAAVEHPPLAERRRLRPTTVWLVGLLGVDAAMLTGAAVASAFGAGRAGIAGMPVRWTLAFAVAVVVVLAVRGLYRPTLGPRPLDDLVQVVAATALAGMAVLSLRLVLGGGGEAAVDAVRLSAFAAAYVGAGRVAFDWSVRGFLRSGSNARPALVVGAGNVGRLVARRLLEQPSLELRPVAFLDNEPLPPGDGDPDIPVAGASWDFDNVVDEYGVEHVVFTFSTASDDVFLRLLKRCEERGLAVSIVPRLFERLPDRLDIDRLGGLPLLTVRRANPRGVQHAVKYALDPLLAGVALVLLSPVMLAAALAVWIDSGRPIFFRQSRAGRDGRPFTMLKFRSMSGQPDGPIPVDALEQLRSGGIEGVDRRTRVGRVLRRMSIDELPQLFNVLRREMSLVGPRPERVLLSAEFDRRVHRWNERTRVKGGITGWAQVHGLRGQTSLRDRAEWDNYYIDNFSLWLDLKILLMTFGAVVRAARSAE